jgi:hypothetical protein
MAIIYPHFLSSSLAVHEKINSGFQYPFFDPACTRYEALRAYCADGLATEHVLEKFGLTEYEFRKSLSAFLQCGTAGLIGIGSKQLTEEMPIEVERKVFVLKNARIWIPATKMVIILKGFNHYIPVNLMRHLYASYGWAAGTKPYQEVDFLSLNLKIIRLCQLQSDSLPVRASFFLAEDRLQTLLEVFRTLGDRGIIKRYPGSKFSFQQNKKAFLSLGLLGLVEKARPHFRNSKLGFKEEGWIILSKIQRPEKNESHYLKILEYKNIVIDSTCLTKIFTRWRVKDFQSQFKGDLDRLLGPETEDSSVGGVQELHQEPLTATPCRLDIGFISYLHELDTRPLHLASPGIFLFLPYLNRLKLYEKASVFMDVDPDNGYSWFSLLLLNLGRILGGISSISKSCRVNELSLPFMAGLVGMPCNDTLLNGLSDISDDTLLQLRRHLTHVTRQFQLIAGKRIAFDFKMRDFTGDDVELKNIGKGPSPKRKICFPGFRPHIAWDIDTGTPISIEFRNGKARATTTVKRFIKELLHQALGDQAVEHVYIDSEYTAEHVWNYIVDSQHGLGSDLTMCIKQNKRVKKYIDSFLQTNPTWRYYDEEHTYTEQTFLIPIQNTESKLQCVLKRKESNGKLRCFGSTLKGLDSMGILKEYRARWTIENGIKDLTQNYYFDDIPGIDPRKVNVHYFIVTLARILYEMFCQDYAAAFNADGSKKGIGTLRPEFIVGTNALLSRHGNELVLKWVDYYPEKQHEMLQKLFEKLNESTKDGLSFLGGLKLKFEIAPPKPKEMRNKLERHVVEF